MNFGKNENQEMGGKKQEHKQTRRPDKSKNNENDTQYKEQT